MPKQVLSYCGTFSNVGFREIGRCLREHDGNALTVDGTIYSYSVHGFYPTGNQVQFAKYNGTTQEDKLLSISMPGGHQITFTWGNGTTAPTNRIYTAADNGSRTVTYGYTSGNLTAVTSPGGRTTNYGYGTALASSTWTGPVASSLITSITDPRGLTTVIEYAMNPTGLNTNLYGYSPTPIVYWEQDPNGVTTQILGLGIGNSQYSLGSSWSADASPTIWQSSQNSYNGTLMFCGEIGGGVSGSGSPATVSVVSADLMGATSFGGLQF